MYWFTYNNAGRPILISGVSTNVSNIDGSIYKKIFVPVSTVRDPRFGRAYDRNDRVQTDWGFLNFSFDPVNCLAPAILKYDSLLPSYGQGEIEQVKLSHSEGTGC